MQNVSQPQSSLHPRRRGRRFLVLLPLIAALAAAATGCGRQPDTGRFFDYGNGKVNLDRITYITPRIKIGVDDFPLNEDGIETVLGHLNDGRWSYFDVQAQIFFDEFLWRVYRSEAFDKNENPLTPNDIAAIERELRAARQHYLAIR